jgi:hypothetical protein
LEKKWQIEKQNMAKRKLNMTEEELEKLRKIGGKLKIDIEQRKNLI